MMQGTLEPSRGQVLICGDDISERPRECALKVRESCGQERKVERNTLPLDPPSDLPKVTFAFLRST